MAIKTRQTTGTGVTNKGAPLTNAELDQNFIDLVASDADKLENLSEDGSPQLGADLDTNGHHIYFDTGRYIKFAGDTYLYYMGYGTYANVIHSSSRALDINVGSLNSNQTLNIQNGVYSNGHKYAATFSPAGVQTLYSANVQKLKTQAYGIEVLGDGTNGSGAIQLNCEVNTHGVKIKGPPHSAGATYTLTLPDDTGSNTEVLQTDGSGNLSWVAQTTAYTDSSVDTHLNTSSANANEVLSYNGSDYAWVAQSSGGGNAFGNIAVSGQSTIQADQASDTLTIVGGTDITVTTNATSDTLTITSTASSTGGVSQSDAIAFAIALG